MNDGSPEPFSPLRRPSQMPTDPNQLYNQSPTLYSTASPPKTKTQINFDEVEKYPYRISPRCRIAKQSCIGIAEDPYSVRNFVCVDPSSSPTKSGRRRSKNTDDDFFQGKEKGES